MDIDLKGFFDEVDHSVLLQLIYNKVKCPVTLRLIRKWLRAPILIKGRLHKRRKGVPQGSPLSPVLSNILLDELDKELKRKKLQYFRYADDFSIYTKVISSGPKDWKCGVYLLKRQTVAICQPGEKWHSQAFCL